MISVIIPVYNVENYLRQCLDSILNQTYTDFEVICVNDGSTDNSLNILNEYAKKDSRIKVISQKNKGLSGARNTGLKFANGEYICFVDSDDYVKETYLETFMKYIGQTDCVQVNFETSITEEWIKKYYKQYSHNYKNKLFKMSPKIYCHTHMGVWDAIYKMEIIKKYKIRFPEGRIFEDHPFKYKYLCHCKNIYWINSKLYYYRIQRESSITQQYKKNSLYQKKHQLDGIKNYISITKHLKKYKILAEYKKALQILFLKEYKDYFYKKLTKLQITFINKFLKIITPKIKIKTPFTIQITIINKTENKNVTPTVYKKLIHFENAEWIENLFGNGLNITSPLKTFETNLKIPNDGIFEFQFSKLNLNEKQTLQLTSIKINDKELLETKVFAPHMLRVKLEKGQPVNLKVSYEVKKFNLNKNRPLIQIQCTQDNNIKITPTKGLEIRNFNYPDDILEQKLIDVIPLKRKNKFTIHNPNKQSLLINFASTLPQNIYYKYIKINGINFSQNYIQANFQNPLSISTGNDENITLEFAYSRHKWF